jgi:uncharacterized protein (TIGR00255 family)
MTATSMTGFARASGAWQSQTWQWEIRGVNGKGLDVRLRLPAGLEHLEPDIRQHFTNAFRRGNLQVSLALDDQARQPRVTLNHELLDQLVHIANDVRAKLKAPPVQAESLLAMRGVIETEETKISTEDAALRDKAIMNSLTSAVADLAKARSAEGARLTTVISEQLSDIEKLVSAARDCPARMPQAVLQRLKEQVAKLLDQSTSFDQDRLHQEAVLIATRADIQEELDRLSSHIVAARDLLVANEAIGRKFDFLAQEFNREANTLCSKANDISLTTIGLDLKAKIEQLREQIQNVE